MKTLISISIFAISYLSLAQPNTEVYLFDVLADNQGSDRLANPVNISQNEGYDNQPAFWPDGKSVIYSRTVNGQTEIARYFLKNEKTEIITNTLQGSEYSPTPTPDGRISSIRLDTTGLQLLYVYDLKGKDEILVKDLVIGYHTWINNNEIVSFVLGDTITMQRINTVSEEAEVIGKNIGRSLHKIPNSNRFSYVDKSSDKWMIKSRNIEDGSMKTLVETLEGSEDYCWTPTGKIIMGKDDKLWIWSMNKEWKEFSDLSDFNLDGISRLTMSPDGSKMVIVVNQ